MGLMDAFSIYNLRLCVLLIFFCLLRWSTVLIVRHGVVCRPASAGAEAAVRARRPSGRGTPQTRGSRRSAVWRWPLRRRSAGYIVRAPAPGVLPSSRSDLSDLQRRSNAATCHYTTRCPNKNDTNSVVIVSITMGILTPIFYSSTDVTLLEYIT